MTTTVSNVTTLDQLLVNGDSTDTPQKVFIGHNLGNRSLTLTVPMYDFFRMSQVANERGPNGEPVAQRKLDPKHAEKLGLYILRGLLSAAIQRRHERGEEIPPAFHRLQQELGKQPYIALQPIVANLRTVGPRGASLRGEPLKVAGEIVGFRCWLAQRDVMWVVDGQHRRKAMDLVFQFLEDVRLTMRYAKKGLYRAERQDVPPDELQVWMECYDVARGYCTVLVELHLGLDIDEERQLFHDLNNLAKKVDTSLALEFDSANPVNAFIKDELISRDIVRVISTTNADDDDGSALSRKDIVAVNAHLFLNKSNINGALPGVIQERIPIARRFWESVTAIPHFGEPGARRHTVAAQPVVLKAIAKLTYDFGFGRQQNDEYLSHLLDNLTDIDFSHGNPMWRWYEMTPDDRQAFGLAGLAEYLPSETEGNRDIGRFQPGEGDGGVMRFGSKHNDIFPIIGDMIRWRLNLPNRHERE